MKQNMRLYDENLGYMYSFQEEPNWKIKYPNGPVHFMLKCKWPTCGFTISNINLESELLRDKESEMIEHFQSHLDALEKALTKK